MITDFLLNIINTVLAWFISIRPSWEPALPSTVQQYLSFLEYYDGVLPINESLTCALSGMTLTAAMIGMKWGKYVLNLIRGSGG